MQLEPYQTSRYIAWFEGGNRSAPVVRFYFQLTTIHSLAAQRLAEFSRAFFQNVLQRRTETYYCLPRLNCSYGTLWNGISGFRKTYDVRANVTICSAFPLFATMNTP